MHITDKLYNKKWGVFNHYLYGFTAKPEGISWNEAIERFDVKKISAQLREVGAGYYFITLCQGGRHLLAPNDTYNRITGSKPGDVCTDRDIVFELHDELSKYGIDLYLYFPSDGPHIDKDHGKKMGFYYETEDVYKLADGIYRHREPYENKVLLEKRLNQTFIDNWSAVLKEYADRYTNKISGWWFDGFYDFFGFKPEWIKPFCDVVKAANPDACVAFNNGVKKELYKWYEFEDYTSGELNELELIPKGRFTDTIQSHILAPLGTTWGSKNARYDNEYMKNYINAVNKNGGVVTVDVGVSSDGSWSEEQIASLKIR
ncbi:MAG: alpha-L-fucosidase [Clostridia bacterium]|nr:alpha-L-fucosidase [Clostridia bacterium]